MKLDNLKKREMIVRIAEFVFIVRQQLTKVDFELGVDTLEDADGNSITFEELVWKAIRERCEADPRMKWVLGEMEEIDRYVAMRMEDGTTDWYLD